jgi:hypothetical protein
MHVPDVTFSLGTVEPLEKLKFSTFQLRLAPPWKLVNTALPVEATVEIATFFSVMDVPYPFV